MRGTDRPACRDKRFRSGCENVDDNGLAAILPAVLALRGIRRNRRDNASPEESGSGQSQSLSLWHGKVGGWVSPVGPSRTLCVRPAKTVAAGKLTPGG